jgi:hypothetical protein
MGRRRFNWLMLLIKNTGVYCLAFFISLRLSVLKDQLQVISIDYLASGKNIIFNYDIRRFNQLLSPAGNTSSSWKKNTRYL